MRSPHLPLFPVMLLLALMLTFPLRLAAGWFADELGLTAREVGGNMWRGRLGEARIASLTIGDVDAQVSPFALVLGRARINFARGDDAPDRLRGAISIGPDSLEVEHVTAKIPLGAVFAPLPLRALDLSDVSARFADGSCQNAEGRVRAEVDPAMPGLAGLSGNARCDGSALLLPLVSQSAMESASVRLSGGNRYHVDLVVRPEGPGGPRTAHGRGLRAAR